MPQIRTRSLWRAATLGACLCGSVSGCVTGCATRERGEAPADTAFHREEEQASGARKVGVLEGLYGPESVRYDSAQDVYFVSNMLGYGSAKDGHGYIVRVSASDPDHSSMFAESGKNGVVLDAPKGLAIQGDTLWTADIDQLRGFDRRTGKPVGSVDLRPQGAVLLNDVAVGPDATIYVTDTGIIMSEAGVLHPGGDKIFAIAPGRSVSVIAHGDSLGRPNGIAWDPKNRRLIVVSFDPFHSQVYALRPGDSTRTVLANGKGKFDGVELLRDGRMLVTSWSDSAVHVFAGGKDDRIIRRLAQPADLAVDTRRMRIAIPLGIMGRVEFWDLQPR